MPDFDALPECVSFSSDVECHSFDCQHLMWRINVESLPVTGMTGNVLTITDVTTAYVDIPPPFKAQYRSEFDFASALTRSPFARTTVNDRALSEPKP